jgi:hypothetical protein
MRNHQQIIVEVLQTGQCRKLITTGFKIIFNRIYGSRSGLDNVLNTKTWEFSVSNYASTGVLEEKDVQMDGTFDESQITGVLVPGNVADIHGIRASLEISLTYKV